MQLSDSLIEFLTVVNGDLLPEGSSQEESKAQLERLRNLPILLIFNKADSLQHVDKVMLENMFQVEYLLEEYPNFNFTFCSALNGTNARDVLDWIEKALSPDDIKIS